MMLFILGVWFGGFLVAFAWWHEDARSLVAFVRRELLRL
jgi:hypothetical protein